MPKKHYATIIGSSPSKGARSPILWNAVYEALDSDVRMVPLDVDEINLPIVLKILESDGFFIGGAVTAPFKETVLDVELGYDLSSEESGLVSSNCIFRSTQNGFLIACNTDVDAAVDCLTEKSGKLKGKTVAILGFGGVGKPLALKLSAMGVNCTVYKRNAGAGSKSVYSFPILDWKKMSDSILDFDIIINATTIGFSSDSTTSDQSPIEGFLIEKISKNTIIYDLIYSKTPTQLSVYANNAGLNFLDGSCMNLNQAILGFLNCNAALSCDPQMVRNVMEKVKNDQGW